MIITSALLNDYFTYDPLSGILYHKKAKQGTKVGSVAGSLKSDGYIHIKIHGLELYAHRAIWQMVHGDNMPPMVDHKDRTKNNNRLLNLRAATSGQNMANSKPRKDSKCGIKGVRFNGRSWLASIADNGKSKHLGSFATAELASAAYAAAAAIKHGAFARP